MNPTLKSFAGLVGFVLVVSVLVTSALRTIDSDALDRALVTALLGCIIGFLWPQPERRP